MCILVLTYRHRSVELVRLRRGGAEGDMMGCIYVQVASVKVRTSLNVCFYTWVVRCFRSIATGSILLWRISE
jgi:hypothetical protein